MPTPSHPFRLLVFTAVLLAGCDDLDGNGADTGGSPATVEVNMVVREFGSGTPLPGATVSVDGTSYTSSDSGETAVTLAEDAITAVGVTSSGFPDYTIYVTTLQSNFTEDYYLGSDASLEAFAAALQLQRDPTKGLLSIGALEGVPGNDAALPGVTIGIDAASEAQLVFDASAGAGFTAGDTTLPGSSSASILVNVAPGTVTPTLTPPAGYTCDLGPETVEVVANGYTIVNYYCHT